MLVDLEGVPKENEASQNHRVGEREREREYFGGVVLVEIVEHGLQNRRVQRQRHHPVRFRLRRPSPRNPMDRQHKSFIIDGHFQFRVRVTF